MNHAAIFSKDFSSALRSDINNQLLLLSTSYFQEIETIYRKYIPEKTGCQYNDIRKRKTK